MLMAHGISESMFVLIFSYCSIWSLLYGIFYYFKGAKVEARSALLPSILCAFLAIYISYKIPNWTFMLCLILLGMSYLYFRRGIHEIKMKRRPPDKKIPRKIIGIQFILFVVIFGILLFVFKPS